MKKLLIIVVAAAVVAVLALPLWLNIAVRQAFQHPDQPWAPGVVFDVAHIWMILQQPRHARTIMETGLQRFPNYPRRDVVTYRIALCYEREGLRRQALQWYSVFLKNWPSHPWADQARHRKALLEAEQS